MATCSRDTLRRSQYSSAALYHIYSREHDCSYDSALAVSANPMVGFLLLRQVKAPRTLSQVMFNIHTRLVKRPPFFQQRLIILYAVYPPFISDGIEIDGNFLRSAASIKLHLLLTRDTYSLYHLALNITFSLRNLPRAV